MAHNKLSPMRVAKEMRPGLYNDGGGLYLRVSEVGTKSWIFRYMLNGRRREAGLGALSDRALPDARQLAAQYRRDCADGVDPIDRRRDEDKRRQLEKANEMTFKQCAEGYIQAFGGAWRREAPRTMVIHSEYLRISGDG
jgi:Arm DNA-binding domain